MIIQERAVLNAAISRKGLRQVSEDAARDLTVCAAAIKTLNNLIDAGGPYSDERHEKWTELEWHLARAQIAIDRLRVIYCDDPIDYKRAALLRGEAAEMGLFGRRDDEG